MSDAGTKARPSSAFSTTTVVMLVLVGVFSFSAMITLSTFAPDLAGPDGGPHAMSRSAIGFAAAIELERARGREVSISRSEETDQKARLLILTPEGGIDYGTLQSLAGTRTLIILPKWYAMPRPDHPGWVAQVSVIPDAVVEGEIEDIVIEPDIQHGTKALRPKLRFKPGGSLDLSEEAFEAGEIASLQTIAGEDLEPVVETEDGKTILAHIANTELYDTYILSDPDLLNTQGLADIDTARAGMRILDALHEPGDPIVFDVTLNGYARSRDAFRLAFEPPLLGATLSLVIAAALLGWRAVAHQTPQVAEGRAIALGKRALAENSAALIRLARREHSMGGRYADLVASVTADQIGIAKKEVEDVPGLLDRIATRSGVSEKFSDLAASAAASQNPGELVAAAKRLHAWNEEVVRATR